MAIQQTQFGYLNTKRNQTYRSSASTALNTNPKLSAFGDVKINSNSSSCGPRGCGGGTTFSRNNVPSKVQNSRLASAQQPQQRSGGMDIGGVISAVTGIVQLFMGWAMHAEEMALANKKGKAQTAIANDNIKMRQGEINLHLNRIGQQNAQMRLEKNQGNHLSGSQLADLGDLYTHDDYRINSKGEQVESKYKIKIFDWDKGKEQDLVDGKINEEERQRVFGSQNRLAAAQPIQSSFVEPQKPQQQTQPQQSAFAPPIKPSTGVPMAGANNVPQSTFVEKTSGPMVKKVRRKSTQEIKSEQEDQNSALALAKAKAKKRPDEDNAV